MFHSRLNISVGCGFALWVGPAIACADTVTHFGDGVGSDVPSLLDAKGIGSTNVASETTAETFTVPGVGSVSLTFNFNRDTGSFFFSFGYFDASKVSADPIGDPEAWATQALSSATEVFDDNTDDPGAMEKVVVDAGTELAFYLIPNNTLKTFNNGPSAFFPSQTANNALRAPLFSVSDANPGQFDQMLAFIDAGVTLFTFEDLTRSGGSDEDFTDLAFIIKNELSTRPVPAVSEWGIASLGLLLLAGLAIKFREVAPKRA